MAEEITHSPTQSISLNKKEVSRMTMDFPTAMKEVISGKRVARCEWGNVDEYGIMKDGYLMIFKSADKKFHQWMVNEGDLLGTDWIVV